MTKRILMSSLQPVGGIKTFLKYVYGNAAMADLELTLLAPGKGLQEYFDEQIGPDRIEVGEIEPSRKSLGEAVRTRLKSGRYSLLHSHGLKTGLFGEMYRTGIGINHLLTIHDVFLPNMFAGLRGRAIQAGVNAILRRCDAIHAVSEDCAKNFNDYVPWVKPERLRAILNSVDTELFATAEPIDVRQALGLPPDGVLVGFFGRFMAQKGFRSLVDAVEILVAKGLSADFRVVTFGWGGFIREDYDYLRAKGLVDYFVQHPGTDEPERWMKGMDLVAMPSRWEACGLVAMEALAAGVPVVGTNCIGLREVLEGSPAKVVAPSAPDELAEVLWDWSTATEKQMALDYVETAKARFGINRCASAIRDLYRELT